MAMSIEELEAEVLNMPEKKRVFLIERLIDSLREQEARDEAADIAEAERRLNEIKAGTATLHDSEAVFARMRRIVDEG